MDIQSNTYWLFSGMSTMCMHKAIETIVLSIIMKPMIHQLGVTTVVHDMKII